MASQHGFNVWVAIKVVVNSSVHPGGGSHITGTWVLIGNLRIPNRYHTILLCGCGLIFFHPLEVIFIKITTHLKQSLQDMFRSCNDHLQLKVELI